MVAESSSSASAVVVVFHRLLRILADTVASSSPLSSNDNNIINNATINNTTNDDDDTFVMVLDPENNTTAVEVAAAEALVKVEEEHEFDAVTFLLINLMLIGCLMISYAVKRFRIYYLPESAGAIVVGILVGGLARLFVTTPDSLLLFEFVSEKRRKQRFLPCFSFFFPMLFSLTDANAPFFLSGVLLSAFCLYSR
jgi:hypothetical protein